MQGENQRDLVRWQLQPPEKGSSVPNGMMAKQVLKDLERIHELSNEGRKRLDPNNSAPLQIYGPPKIHKEGIPLCLIVSTIGSFAYPLAEELTRILSPLVGKTEALVKTRTGPDRTKPEIRRERNVNHRLAPTHRCINIALTARSIGSGRYLE